MVVIAYNPLHMLRKFYVWGEGVNRSIDWLIKRLIKVEARVSYHSRRGLEACDFLVRRLLSSDSLIARH